MNTTIQERVRNVVNQRNQHDPNGVYDEENFRCCPICGNRRETQLSKDDPNIYGDLRDLFVECKLPVPCLCSHKI